MNAKLTKSKSREATSGFMSNLIGLYLIIAILVLIVEYILIQAPLINTLITMFTSSFLFCIVGIGIKTVFEEQRKAKYTECLPTLKIFFNILGTSLLNGVLIGTCASIVLVPIIILTFAGSFFTIGFFSIFNVILAIFIVIVVVLLFIFIGQASVIANFAILDDENIGVLTAFSTGWKMLFSNFKYMALLTLYFWALSLLTLVTFGLSLIYTVPRVMCVQYQMYQDLAYGQNKQSFNNDFF